MNPHLVVGATTHICDSVGASCMYLGCMCACLGKSRSLRKASSHEVMLSSLLMSCPNVCFQISATKLKKWSAQLKFKQNQPFNMGE